MRPATDVWLELIRELVEEPDTICRPRGREVHELIAHQTVVDMAYPIVREPQRNLGYRFMAAEAHWILTGDNRVETIRDFAPGIERFSDDGHRFDGAYGPRVIDQLRYVVDTIHRDNETRQAIIDIWRPNPRDSKDIPCTLSLQFLPRGAVLNTIATMRSSDAWLGWPYDVFNFTMITSYVLLLLRIRGHERTLGNLFINAGSQHLYATDISAVETILEKPTPQTTMLSKGFNPLLFGEPADLLKILSAYSRPTWGINKCPLF